MTGILSKIYICRRKGVTESVSQAILDVEYGLIGDYKSESSDRSRQLVIMLDKDRENINENYKDIGLCTRRFQENILMEGLNINQLDLYDKLKIGESKIEVTSIGKKCFNECELVKIREFCPLKYGVLFASILEGGTVKVGDVIKVNMDEEGKNETNTF